MLKKFDFYAQATIIIGAIILSIISLFVGSYFFGALLLLLPLGIWQLISAACYTFSKSIQKYKQILKYYWIAGATSILFFILGFLFRDNEGNDLAMVLIFIALSGSFLTALYYLYLYKKYLLHAKPAEEDNSIGSV